MSGWVPLTAPGFAVAKATVSSLEVVPLTMPEMLIAEVLEFDGA